MIMRAVICMVLMSLSLLTFAKEAEQGFGIPYKPSTFSDPINLGPGVTVEGYEWGSNSMVINNAIVMAYAYLATGNSKYINGAAEAVDYIMGRNAMDLCYVTGYGTFHTANPHHRFWSNELDTTFPMAPSGVMSGGPNSGLQDPYVRGLGYEIGGVPSQICYVDSIEAWSVNEVTINWNAPFAWMVSFLEDEAGSASQGGNDPTDDTDWGNADESKGDTPVDRVTLVDCVLVAKASASLANLSVQGKKNADVTGDNAVDGKDLAKIMKFVAGQISYEELAP